MGLFYEMQERLKTVGRVSASVYAAAVFISSVGGTLLNRSSVIDIDKRNGDAFKNLPMNDTRLNLGDPLRGVVWKERSNDTRPNPDDPVRGAVWKERSFQMARDIVGNRSFLDVLPFSGYRVDLGILMGKAKIAVVPHATASQPATLVVDEDHGCLLVDYEKTDRENADQARILLDAFEENAQERYDYLGTYTVNADSGNTVKYKAAAESEKEDRASRYCVLDAPSAP